MKRFIIIFFFVFVSQTNYFAQILSEGDICIQLNENRSNTYQTLVKNLRTQTHYKIDSSGTITYASYIEYDSVGMITYEYAYDFKLNARLWSQHYYYDNFKNLIKEEGFISGKETTTNYNYIYQSKFKVLGANKIIFYDELGRKIKEIEEEKPDYYYQNIWKYDSNGNIIFWSEYKKEPNNTIIPSNPKSIRSTIEYHYDVLGRAVLKKCDDFTIENIYDSNGRINDIIFKYKKQNPVHSKILSKDNTSDITDCIDKWRRIYYYDKNNNIIKKELFVNIDRLYRIETFEYNQQNLIEKHTSEEVGICKKETEYYYYSFY